MQSFLSLSVVIACCGVHRDIWDYPAADVNIDLIYPVAEGLIVVGLDAVIFHQALLKFNLPRFLRVGAGSVLRGGLAGRCRLICRGVLGGSLRCLRLCRLLRGSLVLVEGVVCLILSAGGECEKQRRRENGSKEFGSYV